MTTKLLILACALLCGCYNNQDSHFKSGDMVRLKLTGETGMITHAAPIKYDEYYVRRTNYEIVLLHSYEFERAIKPIETKAEKP